MEGEVEFLQYIESCDMLNADYIRKDYGINNFCNNFVKFAVAIRESGLMKTRSVDFNPLYVPDQTMHLLRTIVGNRITIYNLYTYKSDDPAYNNLCNRVLMTGKICKVNGMISIQVPSEHVQKVKDLLENDFHFVG